MVDPSSLDNAINSGSPPQAVPLPLSYGPSERRVAGVTPGGPPSGHLDERLKGCRARVHDLGVGLVCRLRLNQIGQLGGQIDIRALHRATLEGTQAAGPGLPELRVARG